MSDPLFDGGGGDPELAALEQQLGAFAHTAPLGDLPDRSRHASRRRWIGSVLGAATIAGLAVWLLRNDPARVDGNGAATAVVPCTGSAGFSFALSAGSATCGGAPASTGTLPVGGWLETHGANSLADVAIADIGTLTVHGDSRLRLVATGPTEHRIELAHGWVSARVTAPPRLFVVDTPTATAVDLGCAYDLVVGSASTKLTVTIGAVSLESNQGAVYVPATYEVEVLPGRKVGTPVFTRARAEMRAAVALFDRGNPQGLAAMITAAGYQDRVTLWNAINRAHGEDRAQAVAKLEQLAPLPDAALHAKVAAGDADAMDIWLDVFVDRGNLAHDKRTTPP